MPAKVEYAASPRPGVAAVGCVIAALGLALIVIPAAGPYSIYTLVAYIVGAVSLLLGAAVVAIDVRHTIDSASRLSGEERAKLFGQVLFDRHATGLAFFFMVVVLLVSIVTSMLLFNGQLAITARDFAAQLASTSAPAPSGRGKVLSLVLVLSIALSWCGAGLFVVQRLEDKRNDPAEFFNFMEFFRGLWSRIGQANLYTLLFFLLIWGNSNSVAAERVPNGTNTGIAWDVVRSYAWLPVLGLLSGLLVKSAESVVFGLGSRILAAVSGLVGPDNSGPQKSAEPRPATQPITDTTAKHAEAASVTPAVSTTTAPAPRPVPADSVPATETEAKPPAASSRPVAAIELKPNGTSHNPVFTTPTSAPNSAATIPPTPAPSIKRETPIVSPFGSSFSVPTAAPQATTHALPGNGSSASSVTSVSSSTSSSSSHANGWASYGSNGSSPPVRVVPVPMTSPQAIEVRPTIVPVTSPASSSVMVNIERPEVPKLQDVVGPTTTSRPQSSTTGIPQSAMWPALIRVVAPSRMTPNEPKILLPDLPVEA